MNPDEEKVYLSVSFHKISQTQAQALLERVNDLLVDIPRSDFGEMHIHIGAPFEDDEDEG
jgi:hypothetical protein